MKPVMDLAVSLVTVLLLAFIQNVSFSIVSRSRNRNNMRYHILAATCSNTVWFMTFRILVLSHMSLILFVPYVLGTVAGSVCGVRISMVIERWLGASAEAHLKERDEKDVSQRVQEQGTDSM